MFGGRKTSRRNASRRNAYRKGSKTCRRVKSSRDGSRIRRGGWGQWTPNGTRYGNLRYFISGPPTKGY